MNKLIRFFRSIRCPLCLKEKRYLGLLNNRPISLPDMFEEQIRQNHEMFIDLKHQMKLSMQMFKQAKENYEYYMSHLEEKEIMLDNVQRDIESQKEQMLGKDNTDLKKKILLPAMKRKWEAEAKKLDADRVMVLKSTPAVLESLLSRRLELETTIKMVRIKPSTSTNQYLKTVAEAGLKELDGIISLIDRERIEP